MQEGLLPYSIGCIALLAAFSIVLGQEIVDIAVEGISDGVKGTQQQDRNEAILDAKLKAIERAGVSIEAVTVVENFQLRSDWIEAKAKGVILPGFQIIDIGYGQDGLYHVVLSGKVSSGEAIGDTEGDKKFKMAKILLDEKSDISRARILMQEVVDHYPGCSSADDALFYLIKTESSIKKAEDRLVYLRAYYPDSPYIVLGHNHIIEMKMQEEEKKKQERERQLAPIKSMTFVQIPGGSYLMGSSIDRDEQPQDSVIIQPFELMSTEVTMAQWIGIMGFSPKEERSGSEHWKKSGDNKIGWVTLPGGFRSDNHPVSSVSWDDTQAFILKVNSLDPGKNYRLPTEAEWEYACRAGTTTKYYSGDQVSDLLRVARFDVSTHPVGEKEPNAWGLFDMHGNVAKWCEDGYIEYSWGRITRSTGGAWKKKGWPNKVVRGGSWQSDYYDSRSASRVSMGRTVRWNEYGFRLARSVTKGEQ